MNSAKSGCQKFVRNVKNVTITLTATQKASVSEKKNHALSGYQSQKGGLKMTLDEAIKHCLEVAERYETRAKMIDRRKLGFALENPTACHECAADHRQLAEWLTELKEAKRLLKAAVSIINNSFPEVGSCWGCANHDEVNDECKDGAFAECADVCKWQYADEALKLLND